MFSLPDLFPSRGPTHHPLEERGPWCPCCPSHSQSHRTCPPPVVQRMMLGTQLPQLSLLMGGYDLCCLQGPSQRAECRRGLAGRWPRALASGPDADGQAQWTVDSTRRPGGRPSWRPAEPYVVPLLRSHPSPSPTETSAAQLLPSLRPKTTLRPGAAFTCARVGFRCRGPRSKHFR